MSIGKPDDYHIEQNFGNTPRKAEMPWTAGKIYEILPETSETHPMATKAGHRNSISEEPIRPVKEGRRGFISRSSAPLLRAQRVDMFENVIGSSRHGSVIVTNPLKQIWSRSWSHSMGPTL
jgi:hypothetical protein